ncbi:hypothetical protein [Longimycelium tulufanense]|uniref:hypothetical protein n=1 Tax=Longimycelium tulufanense TaxID=907463 RepID=UPI00166DA335|nr:hypothetical protein [Longimycelium tulufanense]
MFLPFTHARSFTWTYLSVPPARLLVMTDSDPGVVRPLFREYPPTFVEGLPIDFTRLEGLARERKRTVFSSVRMFASTLDAVHSSIADRLPRARVGSHQGALYEATVSRGAGVNRGAS